jgi:glycosyltransferase involved in cell wall biosynthesis
MSKPRCIIFFYEGYLDVSPTNVNLAKAVARAGYDVTIYTVPHESGDAGELGSVKVRRFTAGPLGTWLGALGVGRRFRLARVARRLVPGTQPALFALRTLLSELSARGSGASRTVYIGVDLEGGMAAALAAALLGRRFVFVSLELQLSPAQKRGIRGALGRLAYRRSAAALAQGEDRFDLLARELRWRHPTRLTLPNSPFADDTAAQQTRENYFRARFSIPARKRIALQAGMINDISCSAALAVGFIPVRDWALVLHERIKRSPDEPYLAALARSNPYNLYLSLDPLRYDQIDSVFAAADVGLAFYQPVESNDNFRFISPSGKLTHYLKHGKPLLVSALPSLAEIVERHGCGLAIRNPADGEEIGAALEQIASRYEEFSRNATRCFTERFEFGKGVEPVIRLLDRLGMGE